VNVVDVNVTTISKAVKNRCSRIEGQGKQRMLLIGKRRMVEKVNGGDNSI
jgi:hypothetical protein